MEPNSQSNTHSEDVTAVTAPAQPWVKPTIQRIPLTDATNNLGIGPPFDGTSNSAS